jgi:hypothetical protein
MARGASRLPRQPPAGWPAGRPQHAAPLRRSPAPSGVPRSRRPCRRQHREVAPDVPRRREGAVGRARAAAARVGSSSSAATCCSSQRTPVARSRWHGRASVAAVGTGGRGPPRQASARLPERTSPAVRSPGGVATWLPILP